MKSHRGCLATLALALGLFSLGATAQTPTPAVTPTAKTDFSGTWVWVFRQDQNTRGHGGFNLDDEFTFTQDARTITVVASATGRGSVQSVYNVDGSVRPSDDGQWNSKIEWDHSSLVISTAATDASATIRQTWSLDSTGGKLTVVSAHNLRGHDFSFTDVYQKK
jgi:hypothetical protein